MTQEQIDSIRERMCDEYCKWPGMPVQRVLYDICNKCPLNELEASAEKKGRWIVGKYPLYTCSECGGTFQDVGYGFNFCPNCGARMEDNKK